MKAWDDSEGMGELVYEVSWNDPSSIKPYNSPSSACAVQASAGLAEAVAGMHDVLSDK